MYFLENVQRPLEHLSDRNEINRILNSIESIFEIEDYDFAICEKFNILINRRDIESLRDGQWVEDNIINFYSSMMQERTPSSYYFSTFFYQNFLNNLNNNPIRIVNRAKNLNLFSKEKVFWSIFVSGCHWVLVCFMVQHNSIIIYDSLDYSSEYSTIFETIKTFLTLLPNNQVQFSTTVANWIPK